MEPPLPQEPTVAPLPVMRGAASTGNTGDNPWKTVATTFQVNAKVLRQVRPVAGMKGAISRSPFRQGEAHINEVGIYIQGRGIQKVLWMTILGGVGYVLFLFGRVFAQSIIRLYAKNSSSVFLFILIPVLGLLMNITVALVQEYRHVPQEILIHWDDVRELQIEPKMRWAVLVYQVAPDKPGKNPSLHSLPLTIGQPAFVHAFADTVEQYAPGKVAYNVSAYVWTLGRKIAVGALIIIIIGVISLVYAKTH